MGEFIQLRQPKEALELFLELLDQTSDLEKEQIPTENALHRILADPVFSFHPLPNFERSSMDGYAVKAKNTFGASDSQPAYLQVIGEVKMGTAPQFTIEENQCAIIHTGGMIPNGADAVVPLEYTQMGINQGQGLIEILKPVAIGENVIHSGEDVKENEEVLPAGKLLRAAEIGSLMALGITKINVYRKLRIGIISTGDEVIKPESEIKLGQVRDVNTYTVSSIVQQRNHIPVSYGICPDDERNLFEVMKKAHQECDIVVVAAGSSASVRDLTSKVINQLGKPGVIIHGLNIKPGKPTILAVCDNKPVIGLPGNPVSAFVIATLFLNPIIDQCSRSTSQEVMLTYKGGLTVNVSSRSGREEWHPVQIKQSYEGVINVEPIFYKSNLIFSLCKAQGLMKIPSECNGLPVGAEVEFIRI